MGDQLPPAVRRLAGILTALADVRQIVDGLEHEVTMLARETGATWEEIGDGLDISRQAARSRLGTPKRRQR